MPALHALDYLADAASTKIPPVCVAFGDEPFLKTSALAELRRAALGEGEAEFSVTRFEGRSAEPRAVFDELSTVALFGGGGRLVIVDDADEFVTRNRAVLEDYVARPSKAGALVLVVDAWPSNTRLAKAVAAQGLAIECKLPPAARVLKWLESWARSRYRARLERSAAELLSEIVGDEMGLLDQELAKLAAAARDEPISAEMVQRLVGGWRAKTAWDMLDAAIEGRTQQALVELDRLLLGGETAIAVLGQISASLRRFSAAAQLVETAESSGRRANLRQALEAAGVKTAPFIMNKAEAQLRRLGRQRAVALRRWLLDADLALKGSSSSPPKARIVLEQLLVRLSATPSQATLSPAAVRR
jgi:DNA polymerase-3 subunit delta